MSRALPLRGIRLGTRAATLLLAEFSRRRGPRTALLIGTPEDCPVLTGTLAALRSDDALTVVPDAGSLDAPAAVRDRVAAEAAVADRVQVVSALDDAKPAEVVMVARPLSGTATEAAEFLAELRDKVAPGGVLVVPSLARPGDPAGVELRELAYEHGVGTDLLLRHWPALRIHRLRFTPAEPTVAERLAPVDRPSSVPLTAGMHLDSNGFVSAAVCLGVAALVRRARPGSKLWLLPALAAVPVAAFFRDPQRQVPEDDGLVVAASDGKVLSVEHVTDDKFGVGDGNWLRIAVFLSVFDVHINRAPVAGRVIEVFREQGGYAAAMKPAAEHNVAAYTVIESAHGPVVVAQRTGMVARRIVHRVPAGSLLARGERFGLIRFGSRTDVYLPATATALVAPGDKVAGGSTVLASLAR